MSNNMKTNEIKDGFSDQWKKSFINAYNSNSKLTEAEFLRNRIYLLDLYDKKNPDLKQTYINDYAFLVDSKYGLNNYANTLLSHITMANNSCRLWKSNTNVDSCLELLEKKSKKSKSFCDKEIKFINKKLRPDQININDTFKNNPIIENMQNVNLGPSKADNHSVTEKENTCNVVNKQNWNAVNENITQGPNNINNINNNNANNRNHNITSNNNRTYSTCSFTNTMNNKPEFIRPQSVSSFNSNDANYNHHSYNNNNNNNPNYHSNNNSYYNNNNINSSNKLNNRFNQSFNTNNHAKFDDDHSKSDWSTSQPQSKRSRLDQRSFKGHWKKNGKYGLYNGSYDDDDCSDDNDPTPFNNSRNYNAFKTAKQQLIIDSKKTGSSSLSSLSSGYDGTYKKSLGARRGPGCKFIPPVPRTNDEFNETRRPYNDNDPSSSSSSSCKDPALQHLDPKMIELISNEIMDHGPPVAWEDIAGLEFAKKTIKEIVVWPMLRPDIFTGLRGPPKGLLLFGPPGTGKTLIGKCIASQSKSTFFSISASSLTSKWVGEGEKMVRTLFAVARVHQPAVIFMDEIDSLLCQRSEQEHESSRRIKTEFLVQLDGATTGEDDRILVVGATNRPQEIDEAARRRFVKRLYIPLPESSARKQIICRLLMKQRQNLLDGDVDVICSKTEGYSGADMANLCREAALGPIRRLDFSDIQNISEDQVQAIDLQDFLNALKQVKASVSNQDLKLYLDWNQKFGSWDV